MIRYLRREQTVTAPLAEVWDFFCDPRNLNAITPPEMDFRILTEPLPRMYQGQIIEYSVGFMPLIRSRWLTEIAQVRELEYFVDEQRSGPYRLWYHEHHFQQTARGVALRDQVTYEVGFGPIGDFLAWAWIDRKLQRIFDYRKQVVAQRFGDAG
jgi:ligand-binding SRPBCC domain-containing protein